MGNGKLLQFEPSARRRAADFAPQLRALASAAKNVGISMRQAAEAIGKIKASPAQTRPSS